MTQRSPYGLLGRTLGHSWSPAIHRRLGSAPYALFEREPDEVADFVRNGDWRGLNVTIPYKREAARLADVTSPRVERLGAANTLVRLDDGSILAENTDVLGFAWMLARFARRTIGCGAAEAFGGTKALVLGSGGAASAVTAALEEAVGAKPCVISRKGPETYETLAERHRDATLVVNATPVGMYPDCPSSPVTEETLASLPRLKAVVDVVYNPERTGICQAAERLGIPCESGLAMLVAQAAYASELWLDRDFDDELVEAIERDLRRSTRNVVIIGMPGGGKTSAGRRLARLSGRPFVDFDTAFEAECGITPEACIRERGEEAFRDLESEVAAAYGGRSGLVIACGGGIVTRPANYELLHQNGTIVFLDRPLGELSVAGRPLSQSRGVEALAAERMDAYRTWADVRLPCTGTAAGDARALADLLGIGQDADATTERPST